MIYRSIKQELPICRRVYYDFADPDPLRDPVDTPPDIWYRLSTTLAKPNYIKKKTTSIRRIR